jgi:predicted transglutaminase-like cysteine proteinase
MQFHRSKFYCDAGRFISTMLVCLAVMYFVVAASVSALDKSLLEARMLERYGSTGVERLKQWQTLINDIKDKSDDEKITSVNNFLNLNIHFQDDKQLWKNIDYWATPLETLGMSAGDCEDYTIIKYFTLLQAGVAVDRLRFIYVKAQIGDASSRLFQAHMVLGYYQTDDSVPYILDNLVSTVELANHRTDLKPVFSFNSDGIWVGNQQAKADPTARLSRWRDLLQRTQADGF